MNVDNADGKLLNNQRIQEIRQHGFNTVGDIWIEYDRYRYEDSEVFLNMLNELQQVNTCFVLKRKLLPEAHGKC